MRFIGQTQDQRMGNLLFVTVLTDVINEIQKLEPNWLHCMSEITNRFDHKQREYENSEHIPQTQTVDRYAYTVDMHINIVEIDINIDNSCIAGIDVTCKEISTIKIVYNLGL